MVLVECRRVAHQLVSFTFAEFSYPIFGIFGYFAEYSVIFAEYSIIFAEYSVILQNIRQKTNVCFITETQKFYRNTFGRTFGQFSARNPFR